MSARDLAEWQAESNVEPHGDELLKWLFAKLCQTVVAAAGGTAGPLKEYFLSFDPADRELPDDDELEDKMTVLAAAHNRGLNPHP
jgi:hypothetical protein